MMEDGLAASFLPAPCRVSPFHRPARRCRPFAIMAICHSDIPQSGLSRGLVVVRGEVAACLLLYYALRPTGSAF